MRSVEVHWSSVFGAWFVRFCEDGVHDSSTVYKTRTSALSAVYDWIFNEKE